MQNSETSVTEALETARLMAIGALEMLEISLDQNEDEFSDQEEDLDQPNEMLTKLQIHFLFPNLDNDERMLIEELNSIRHDYIYGVNVARDGLGGDDKMQLERTFDAIEGEFMETRQAILRSGLLEKLTPLQKKLMEEYYFTIPFEEED